MKKHQETYLAPTDSIDLEELNIPQATQITACKDWIVLSLHRNSNNFLAINYKDKDTISLVRVGRGPQEMMSAFGAHSDGGKLVFTEINALVSASIDMSKLADRVPKMDTIGIFRAFECASPKMVHVNGGHISPPSSRMEGNDWCCLWDDEGHILSSIPRPMIENMESAGSMLSGPFFGSSLMALNPDKTRLCVALPGMAAVSFAELSGGSLNEIKRIEFNQPSIEVIGNRPRISRNKRGFCGISPYEDSVILLYSGREQGLSDVPAYAGDHLMIYTWDGVLKKRYRLAQAGLSICVADGKLFCLSDYPNSMIYIFDL